jgi:hypothetical protein
MNIQYALDTSNKPTLNIFSKHLEGRQHIRDVWVDRMIILKLLLLFMSMGWDYVSELRPQTSLFYISQMIYENRVPVK